MPITSWNTRRLMRVVEDEAVEAAAKKAAIEGERVARSHLVMQGLIRTGQLAGGLKVEKSKFPKGGWLFGVFDKATAKWDDSLGARAWYNEYGHAGPGTHTGKKRTKATRRKAAAGKVVPPRPFMRPALAHIQARVQRWFQDELDRRGVGRS